jgi:signal transduction histidine kinase/ActR/RegA family two-component response regulator
LNRRRGIRWHLLQVQLLCIVPIGLFAAAMLYFHWQVQEQERQRAQTETVRLMAAAVDGALGSTIERLSIFARLWVSSGLSDAAIQTQAREALGANADWRGIVGFDSAGRAVLRTDAPLGESSAATSQIDVWSPVFAEKKAVISELLFDPVRKEYGIAVGVPVVRNGSVVYALVANLDLGWYDRLLTKQGQPDGAVAGLIDRNYKFVARSFEGEERRGGDPTPQFIEDVKVRPEAVARYTNLNGTAVYTAWTRTRHGWLVGFATPSAPVDNAFWDHLLVFGFVWLSAMAIGVLYAFSKGRVIARSLESLEAQAENISAGKRIGQLPDANVEEVNRALRALEKASELLQTTMRERDRSFETEREARAVAEAANQAKDEFLAMLGHELRNPLAAVMTATTIVRNEHRTAEQLDFAVGVIERQSWNLKRLIDDLLDVARAMTGKIVLERRPIDLAAAARHVVTTLSTAEQFEDRQVKPEVTSIWVDGDQTRIEQVISNLLINAARYSSSGGQIELSVRREGSEAVLEVKDDGQGIAREDLPRVFELFFQAPVATNRAGSGLGIGLTLVRRLARMHGGEATAHSEGRGKGATFTVRLPAIAAPERAMLGAHVARARHVGTVLVVEDNDDTRESLAVALELHGYRVLQSGDGAQALELLRSRRPPIAVLDIGLPGLDGYELARHARAEFGREITLIALTSYGATRDADEARRAGFDHHLTKPVDVNELARVIEQAGIARAVFASIPILKRA